MNTLTSTGNLADLLREKGDLDAATAELGDAVAVANEVLGAAQINTLIIEAQAAHITLARSGDAEPLREVVARMREALGEESFQTRKYAAVLD